MWKTGLLTMWEVFRNNLEGKMEECSKLVIFGYPTLCSTINLFTRAYTVAPNYRSL